MGRGGRGVCRLPCLTRCRLRAAGLARRRRGGAAAMLRRERRAWLRACVDACVRGGGEKERRRRADEYLPPTYVVFVALVIVYLVVFGHPMPLLPRWTHFLAACRSHGLRDFSAPSRRRLRPDAGREMKRGGRRQRQIEEAGAATPHVEEAEGD